MTRRLSRPSAFLLLVRIALVAVSVPLLMRLPLPRLQSVLEPRRPRRRASPDELRALAARVDWALASLRAVVRPGCLSRGVTRYWFLSRAGAEVSLAFGVAREAGAGDPGHCWLVLDGAPFLERVDPRERFVEVVRIPGLAVAAEPVAE